MKNLSHFPKTDIRFWQKTGFPSARHIAEGKRWLTQEWHRVPREKYCRLIESEIATKGSSGP